MVAEKYLYLSYIFTKIFASDEDPCFASLHVSSLVCGSAEWRLFMQCRYLFTKIDIYLYIYGNRYLFIYNLPYPHWIYPPEPCPREILFRLCRLWSQNTLLSYSALLCYYTTRRDEGLIHRKDDECFNVVHKCHQQYWSTICRQKDVGVT